VVAVHAVVNVIGYAIGARKSAVWGRSSSRVGRMLGLPTKEKP
jgi:hypothetical protein